MDRPILPRVAAGEQNAVRDCLLEYGGLVQYLARKYLRNATDREDVIQEIFIEIWKHAGRFDEDVAAEKTFIVMIARRRLIDRRRKDDRQLETSSLEQPVQDGHLASAAEEMDQQEELNQAHACLAQLKQQERGVLERSLLQGNTQQEISEFMNLPLGTVKSLARRGLIKLRDCVRSRTAVKEAEING